MQHFVTRPGEAFDRLDLQVARRLKAVRCDRSNRDVHEIGQPSHHRLERDQTRCVAQPLTILPSLVDQLRKFDQRNPTTTRKVFRQSCRLGTLARLWVHQLLTGKSARPTRHFHPANRQTNLLQRLDRPLRFNIEPAQRFEFVAEELQPQRIVRVRRIDIDDAAMHTDFTRQFDGGDALKAPFDHPAQQLIDIDAFADLKCSRGGRDFFLARNRLNERRPTRHDHARRRLGPDRSQRPQSSSPNSVRGCRLTWPAFPRWEDQQCFAKKVEDVIGKLINVVHPRQHDNQRFSRFHLLRQRRDNEPGRRAPRPINGSRLPSFHRGDHRRKRLLPRQQRSQLAQGHPLAIRNRRLVFLSRLRHKSRFVERALLSVHEWAQPCQRVASIKSDNALRVRFSHR